MDSYTLFLAGALALGIVIDLATWARSRSLAVSLNAILFTVVGIVTMLNIRTGDGTVSYGTISFGCISFVIAVGWVLYGISRYKRGKADS